MVTHKIRTLSDLIQLDYWLKAVCDGCGHEARLEPVGLRQRLFAARASLEIDRVADRLKCSQCGGKRINAGACHPPE